MRHVKVVTAQRPAIGANDFTVISNLVSLLTAILGLLEQITTVFGINFNIGQKDTTET